MSSPESSESFCTPFLRNSCEKNAKAIVALVTKKGPVIRKSSALLPNTLESMLDPTDAQREATDTYTQNTAELTALQETLQAQPKCSTCPLVGAQEVLAQVLIIE